MAYVHGCFYAPKIDANARRLRGRSRPRPILSDASRGGPRPARMQQEGADSDSARRASAEEMVRRDMEAMKARKAEAGESARARHPWTRSRVSCQAFCCGTFSSLLASSRGCLSRWCRTLRRRTTFYSTRGCDSGDRSFNQYSASSWRVPLFRVPYLTLRMTAGGEHMPCGYKCRILRCSCYIFDSSLPMAISRALLAYVCSAESCSCRTRFFILQALLLV